jgi:hypothetical protein
MQEPSDDWKTPFFLQWMGKHIQPSWVAASDGRMNDPRYASKSNTHMSADGCPESHNNIGFRFASAFVNLCTVGYIRITRWATLINKCRSTSTVRGNDWVTELWMQFEFTSE